MHLYGVVAGLLGTVGGVRKFILQCNDFIVLKSPRRFSGQPGQKTIRHRDCGRGYSRLVQLVQYIQIGAASGMAELDRALGTILMNNVGDPAEARNVLVVAQRDVLGSTLPSEKVTPVMIRPVPPLAFSA